MTRISVADLGKLSLLVGGRAWRNARTQVRAHPLLRWRFNAGKTDRLVIAPQDVRTGDATRASEIYSGRFAFAGKVVIADRRSPFDMQAPSEEWAVNLHSFGWLRHLRAADSAITRANARALIDDWISLHGGWNALSWRADILSRRVLSWLCQSPLILQDADARFYRRFLRSLTRQVRYLQRNVSGARDGLPKLQALITLAYVALCMQDQSKQLRSTVRKLLDELERQVLPDGGHVSRNPNALIELLLDLLPLRQVFSHRNIPPPAGLNRAIDRMMPMLRFFRHGDGHFALFNGMGPTPVDLLATVLAYDDARGAPVSNAPHSGYQRAELGKTILMMDTGRPPPLALSQEAHAGCLSFELSWKAHRVVVNCGLPAANRENWRPIARATPAHSAAAFNDTSFCRFLESPAARRMLLGAPIVAGPHEVNATREETPETVTLRCSHDGYAADLGIVHERTLVLSEEGAVLDGTDAFTGSLAEGAKDEFAIRFHLHPLVKANRLSDGRGVMLTLPDREVWTFTAENHTVEIAESVYLAGPDGPRRAVQIVLYGHARATPKVQWSLRHTPRASHGQRRTARPDEPELPL